MQQLQLVAINARLLHLGYQITIQILADQTTCEISFNKSKLLHYAISLFSFLFFFLGGGRGVAPSAMLHFGGHYNIMSLWEETKINKIR